MSSISSKLAKIEHLIQFIFSDQCRISFVNFPLPENRLAILAFLCKHISVLLVTERSNSIMNGAAHSGNIRKKRPDPKVHALILIGILLIPGNLVTLLFYSSTNEGAYIFSCSYKYIL